MDAVSVELLLIIFLDDFVTMHSLLDPAVSQKPACLALFIMLEGVDFG